MGIRVVVYGIRLGLGLRVRVRMKVKLRVTSYGLPQRTKRQGKQTNKTRNSVPRFHSQSQALVGPEVVRVRVGVGVRMRVRFLIHGRFVCREPHQHKRPLQGLTSERTTPT